MTPAQRALIESLAAHAHGGLNNASVDAIRALLAAHDELETGNSEQWQWAEQELNRLEADTRILVADNRRLAERVRELEGVLRLLLQVADDHLWPRESSSYPAQVMEKARAALAPAASPGQTAGEDKP